MSFLRIKTFLRSMPARLQGTHIGAREDFTSLSSRAVFEPDLALQARIKAAREVMAGTQVKADRKLIEEQPDYGERQPVDFERLPP